MSLEIGSDGFITNIPFNSDTRIFNSFTQKIFGYLWNSTLSNFQQISFLHFSHCIYEDSNNGNFDWSTLRVKIMAKPITYIMELEFALVFNFICTVFIRNFPFLCIISKVIRQLLTLTWKKTLNLKKKINS